MKIALDWDDTFTRDIALWATFVANAQEAGHEVRIVTFRRIENVGDILATLKEIGLELTVHCTGQVQKRDFCNALGWLPDVWIDDGPEFIVSRSWQPPREWSPEEMDEYFRKRRAAS